MHRLLFLLSLTFAFAMPGYQADAQTGERCFPETGKCIKGVIRAYWEANGGLPVFGFPTTDLATEKNAEGFSGPTQWFERDRLEDHSAEGKGVLAGRLGAQKLAMEGRPWESARKVTGAAAGCVFFAETGHSLCPPFRAYWEQNGGLPRFGFPIGEPVTERNADGFTGTFQWFERRRMEVHPENQPPYTILLGLLGNEVRSAGSTPPPPPPPPAAPAAGRPSVFGVEISRGTVAAVAARAAEANASWARYNGILWPEVEASRGARDWSKLKGVEEELKAMSARGMTPVVLVRGTPGWAQKVAGSSCGPIKADALGAFADFMRELVTRYSAAPFNVKYWELGNEPDVDPALVPGDSQFGCWGDESDAYYGGGYYAEMLKQVYPAVKQADRNAQVVIGGLLLDCDPTNPPAGKSCKPAQFLEGILRNGGANAFDIISYHAYSYWNAGQTDKDLAQPGWQHRGGALLGKLDFIRSVQARYSVNKPILMDEGSLLCYPGTPNCPGDAFLAAQANYSVRMYARAWANGLLGAAWYTLNDAGWRESEMLEGNQRPRPVYTSFKFMATLLKDSTFAGRLGQGQIEGYAFRAGATTYQVYWTNDTTARTVPAPAGLRAVYTIAGQQVTSQGNSVAVGFDPIIVESRTP